MNPAEPEWVEVFRAKTSYKAHAARLALEAADIPVLIDGESLQSACGSAPLFFFLTPRVLVPAPNVDAARAIIEQIDESVPPEETDDEWNSEEDVRCLSCGARMDKSAARCVQCGWTYAMTD